MTPPEPFRIHARMTPRSISESHRVSSPLELLFDLTFVVAISRIAEQLAEGIWEGHSLEGLIPYILVFFAIWWAWMNFTWFASGYDTDDVPYRLLTMAQMAGVLVLAAGVHAAFTEGRYGAITAGYLIMRMGLVAQWLRAAREGPETRGTAVRYAVGVSIVQALWLLRLLTPEDLLVPTFVVLALLELAVPLWAQRAGDASWHPHHIAERYGLFTIILLGEGVLAAVSSVQTSLDAGGISSALITVAVSSLVLIFALWWLYYLEPSAELLERRRELSFVWGYAHYGVFAALAALGAGLEVAVRASGHHREVSSTGVAAAVAVPVGVFLVVLWAIHAPLRSTAAIRAGVILPGAGIVLLSPLAASLLGAGGAVAIVALVCALVVVMTVLMQSRSASGAGREGLFASRT